MKLFHVFVNLFLLFSANLFGQNIETILEKREFKKNELINVSFETLVKIDSVVEMNLVDFETVDGPYKTISISIVNGRSQGSSKISYTLKAKRSGTLKIIPPRLFSKSIEIFGINTIIIVSEIGLTDDDKKEIEYNTFVEKHSKPNGTTRYVIKDEMGYIERYKNPNWEFYRKLTKKEIRNIKKIK